MPESSVGTHNTALLKEIRDTFDYFSTRWADIRAEANKDMKFVSGDPWEPSEKRARQDGEGNWIRPCLVLDELGQYLNQFVNGVRQNKRTGKVLPKGNGANDESANRLQGIIRGIEYASKAQSAYITGLESAAMQSMGAWEVCSEYESSENDGPGSFNQVLCIKRIANVNTVYPDPDAKEADFSDMKKCFKVTSISHDSFKAKYPDAEIRDFDSEHMEAAPRWIKLKEIQVGEYWKVKIKARTLVLVDGGDEGPTTHYKDELPKDFKGKILKERRCELPQVMQYITNGVEILEENKIPGSYIRIVIVVGKELWIDDGSGAKRVLMSLIRLARDPQMLLNYAETTKAEVLGMSPKTPYMGAVGQFSTETDWANINKIPVGYAEYNAKTEATGDQILPPPARPAYEPQIQPLEMAKESARRSIQSAMGITALPTAAQRQNEKSGIALERIESQQAIGSYHLIDNYERSLEHTWRIMAELVPIYYDTARDVPIRKDDETHSTMRINDPQYMNPKTNQMEHNPVTGDEAGEHDVTISTGPSRESQREEVSDFITILVGNIQAIAQLLPPGAAAKIMALAIKLKTMGPIGDEMADIMSPPADQAAQQQQIAQGQQKLQQQQEVIVELQKEVESLRLEKAGKVIQGENAKELAKINSDVKVLIAEIQTQQQNTQQRMEMFMQYWKETHGSAHEAAMQAVDHSHEKDMASQAQDAAAQQAQQQAEQQPQQAGQ